MKILFVFTGGTIGSVAADGVIRPDGSRPRALLAAYERAYGLGFSCECAEPYTALSENNTGDTLRALCACVAAHKDRDYDGIFASTDAGNVSKVCPTFHPTLKIAEPDVALHTKEFEEAVRTEVAHKAIADGAKLIALQAIRMFGDETNFVAMKSEFEK